MSGEGKFVPTLNVLVSGALNRLVEDGEVKGEVLIPWALIAALEDLARRGDVKGEKGLSELKKLRENLRDKEISLKFIEGEFDRGDLDSLVREVAFKRKATMITDKAFHVRVADATGIKTLLVRGERRGELSIDGFFDEETMSIHLKENVVPYAKKGFPGNWRFTPIREKPVTREEIERIIEEIRIHAEDGESFLEIDKREIMIVQLRDYRIVVTRPPLSDGLELTAVKPVVKLSLADYKLPFELVERLDRSAEGILIAGAPGEGKTTFAQALAEFYMDKGKVVKTIEAPRDLQLPEDITQYSKTIASAKEIHDILLLSRPDYTIFDEMRNDEDFRLYMDLRLAGVGMVGVVHATSPIDAVQRFIERVDLGMIPSILDTVIFIEEGRVKKVYEVKLVAKVPYGLKREDLARPIVEVRDFFTKQKEYEMYVFGKRIFVIPLRGEDRGLRSQDIVESAVKKELGRYVEWVKVKFVSSREAIVYVPEVNFESVERKIKRKIKKIERRYSVSLILQPFINYNSYTAFKFTD